MFAIYRMPATARACLHLSLYFYRLFTLEATLGLAWTDRTKPDNDVDGREGETAT